MHQAKTKPLLTNPPLREVRRLLAGHSHLRGIAAPSELILWVPTLGDHDFILQKMNIDKHHALPLRFFETFIEPNFHMSGAKWEKLSEFDIHQFLESHPAIKPLLCYFEIL